MDQKTKNPPKAPPPNTQNTAKPPSGGAKLPPAVADVFKRLLMAAMKLMYADEATAQQLLQMVSSAPTPGEGIANATRTVVDQIAERAKGISPEIVQRIALPVGMLIYELAVTAKVIEDDPNIVKQAIAAWRGGGQQQRPAQEPAEEALAPEGMVSQAMEG